MVVENNLRNKTNKAVSCLMCEVKEEGASQGNWCWTLTDRSEAPESDIGNKGEDRPGTTIRAKWQRCP